MNSSYSPYLRTENQMRERLAELEGLESAVAMMGLDPVKLAKFGRDNQRDETFHSTTMMACVDLNDAAVRFLGLNESGLKAYRERYDALLLPDFAVQRNEFRQEMAERR